MPSCYNMFAESNVVRLLGIRAEDFFDNLSSDVRKKFEEKMWLKLGFIVNRLKTLNNTFDYIVKLDKATSHI